MKKIVVAMLILFLGAYGCAGRTPNPMQTYQYGDEKRSCNALRAEISNIDSDIQTKLPNSDKTGSNVALGVTGAIFIVPLFFMDFSKADQIEVEAMRRRYNSLVIISAEKNCGFEYKQMPDFQKSVTPATEAK
jgi:hypothetical protein